MHFSTLAREKQRKTYDEFRSYKNWAVDTRRILSTCTDPSTRSILDPHITPLVDLSAFLDRALTRFESDRRKQTEMYEVALRLLQIKSTLVGQPWDRAAGLVHEAVFLVDSMLTDSLLFLQERHITFYATQVAIMRKDFQTQPESTFSDERSLDVFVNFFRHAKDLGSYIDIIRTANLDPVLKRQLGYKKRELLRGAWGALIRHAGPWRGSAEKAGDLAEAIFKDTQVALDWLCSVD